ncbi:TetR family transcriptional regulator [Clostridium sp. MSJ-11]|uniref:TetR family transcriptional regulator n=1 Tax=Clostridium mobile TaxID=2841512 RepID=A0ABS6EJ21_9CLOT|nr:TetR family transcriptional regulator [Clostridium mobile]MBU5485206.1 TetR family transcriptional regulator [Clostridium mobile]
MPTDTFFNLPLEKKNKIIEAIKKEFARVPFDKVSINKIVQDANISRGSFYMYFEDKKDMLIYLLSNYHEEVMSIIKESFKRNSGDVFEVFADILKFTANFGTAKENIAFCMNIFSNQTLQNDIILQFANRGRKNDFFNLFKEYTDTKSLNLQSPNDVDDIIDILISVTQKATMDIFLCIGEKDEILEAYTNKITILKRGMLKENS